MKAKSAGKLDAQLEAAIADELKEVTRKHKEDAEAVDGERGHKRGEFVYGTVERMRVIDRALKLAALKLKMDSPEWGSEFEKD